MDPKEIDRQLAINQMVLRSLERSGMLGKVAPSTIKAGLRGLDTFGGGSGSDVEKLEARNFFERLAQQHPDNVVGKEEEWDDLYSQPSPNYPEGFTGRGWPLGSNPGPYEASSGDRWANEVTNDLFLAKALMDGKDYDNRSSVPTYGMMHGGSDPGGVNAVDQYIQMRGAEGIAGSDQYGHGIKWDLLALVNDPYSRIGGAMAVLNDRPSSWAQHNFTRNNDGFDLRKALTRTDVGDLVNARYVSQRPALIHDSVPENWQEAEKSYRDIRSLHSDVEPRSFADSYRLKHGKNPSWLRDKANSIGEMFADYGTLVAPVLGGGSGLLRGGLKAGVKGAVSSSLSEALTEDLPIATAVEGVSAIAGNSLPKSFPEALTDFHIPEESSLMFQERTGREDFDREKRRERLKEYQKNIGKSY